MPGEGFVGANVTVPHKLAALALADEASEAARAIGAANTLSFADGRIAAENTDATGFLDALPESPGRQARARARRGRLGARRRLGAGRRRRRGVDLEPDPREGRALAARARRSALERPKPVDAADFDLIVNATTVGMGDVRARRLADLKSLPIDADSLGETHQLVDLAYGSAETELAQRGESARRNASSTGSRCWSARGPRRFGSGPGWTPRSRR